MQVAADLSRATAVLSTIERATRISKDIGSGALAVHPEDAPAWAA
jgi:hypothetical protein